MRNMFDGHVGIQEGEHMCVDCSTISLLLLFHLRNVSHRCPLSSEMRHSMAGLPSLLKELSAEGIDVSSLMEEDVMTQVRNLVGSGRVNGDVRDALQCLRFEGYQTGLVCWEWPLKSSDTSTSVQKRSRSEMKRHFNVIVESKNEKLSRIDPDNYALLARRADLQPREMIYVDSRPELLEPAKVAGMYTVLCDTDTGGIKQVETLLGLPLANFAWSRDVYAKVLWTSNKDCLHQDEQ